MNYDLIYDIYENSINKNKLERQDFANLLNKPDNKVFVYEDKAFYIRNKNSILLLCVKERYHNFGIGTELLKKCENDIKKEGYSRSKLGILDEDSFLKGVPFETDEFMFFDKRGYEDTNIISDNLFSTEASFKNSDSVNVEYLKKEDFSLFKMYFDVYDYTLLKKLDLSKPIIVAKEGNKFIGFCQTDEVNFREFENKVGLVKNLFILPKYRRTEKGYSILEFVRNNFVNDGITNFEIIRFNSKMFQKDISGKTYIKYYVGSKDLDNE